MMLAFRELSLKNYSGSCNNAFELFKEALQQARDEEDEEEDLGVFLTKGSKTRNRGLNLQ